MMNYKKIYASIIDRSKVRKIDGYVEKHHIIPKSLGGSDEKSNLVELTAREHFLCHYLLTKIFERESFEWYKMVNAFLIMKANSTKQDRYFNSHLYESLKKEASIARSLYTKGEGNSQFGSMWIHNLDLKKSRKIKKDEFSNWQLKGWLKGRVVNFDKTKPKKLCKKCGSEECERPNVCSKHQMVNTLINVFGLDKDKFGTSKFYKEFDRIVEKLSKEYHEGGLSTIDLSKKYGISTQRIDSVFKSLNISHRSKSAANKNFRNR